MSRRASLKVRISHALGWALTFLPVVPFLGFPVYGLIVGESNHDLLVCFVGGMALSAMTMPFVLLGGVLLEVRR